MYDVIIIGSGPAGLTAAIYTSRSNLKTLIIAGLVWGGQLMLTSLVENYPGFPEGIMGPDLMMKMRKQAEKHGAEIIDENFKYGDFLKSPLEVITESGKKYLAKSIIIATGAETKWLGVPGEKEKIGRGVSSCAPCDAAFYKGKKVIVVGGGDSAMEEALFLTKFAEVIFVVHRREELRASKIMQERAFSDKKIHFVFNTVIEEVLGDQKVEAVRLRTIPSDKGLLSKSKNQIEKVIPDMLKGKVVAKDKTSVTWDAPIEGLFVAIGHEPNSKLFKGIETDKEGFIKVYDHTKTNIKNVFVAGDVHDDHYKQAVTAAGFGCMAALDVEKCLREKTC